MSGRTKSILVIEDEPTQLKILAEGFAQKGFEVLTASGGNEGLKKVRENKPDIVVLDLIMVEGDGITLLYKINTDAELKNIPVAILTNMGEHDKAEEHIRPEKDKLFTKTNHPLSEIIEKISAMA